MVAVCVGGLGVGITPTHPSISATATTTTSSPIPAAWGAEGGLPRLRLLSLSHNRLSSSSSPSLAAALAPFLPPSSVPSRPLVLEVLRLSGNPFDGRERTGVGDGGAEEVERWTDLSNLKVRRCSFAVFGGLGRVFPSPPSLFRLVVSHSHNPHAANQ